MKSTVPPELKLYDDATLDQKQDQEVVVAENFDSEEALKKIVELRKNIEKEKAKLRPEYVFIARWQREIVKLREEIKQNYIRS